MVHLLKGSNARCHPKFLFRLAPIAIEILRRPKHIAPSHNLQESQVLWGKPPVSNIGSRCSHVVNHQKLPAYETTFIQHNTAPAWVSTKPGHPATFVAELAAMLHNANPMPKWCHTNSPWLVPHPKLELHRDHWRSCFSPMLASSKNCREAVNIRWCKERQEAKDRIIATTSPGGNSARPAGRLLCRTDAACIHRCAWTYQAWNISPT